MTINFQDPEVRDENAEYVNFHASEHDGELLIVEVHEIVHDVNTKYGVKNPPRCTVTVVDSDLDPYEDALIFGSVLTDQLKNRVGTTVLGRMTQGTDGSKTWWKLEPAGDADKAAAEAFLAKRKVKAMADPSSEPF